MLPFLARYWFLLGLALTLVGAGWFGHSAPSRFVEAFLRTVHPPVTTAIVLFLMSFTLDAGKRREALTRPWGALCGSLINLGCLPLIAWPLASWQSLEDFRWGLFITAATPCTLATASVFTRRAGGNDAQSLVTTLVTNLGCVIVTPFWLQLFLRRESGFDGWRLVPVLMLSVVLPTVAGLLTQGIPAAGRFSLMYRSRLSVVAQWCVLLLVGVAATDAGRTLARQPVWPSVGQLIGLVVGSIGLHGAGLLVGWSAARGLGLSRGDRIAIAIAGSQKTLPVGLMIVTNPLLAGGETPFLTFPLVVYHAAQLLIDAWLAERWRTRSLTGG